MIEIKNLKKVYNNKTVLTLNDLRFKQGQRYAIIGANGSGKSTLLKIIAGICKPSNGDIKMACDAFLMPQKSYGFSMSVINNIMLGVSLKNYKSKKANAHLLLKKLLLDNLTKANGSTLSGGETQRVALCRTLLEEHKILLLDEPTASMDIKNATIAEEMILDYSLNTNGVLIFATHSISQAKRLATQIIFLSDGELVEIGSPKDILENPKQQKTKDFLNFSQ